MRHQRCKHAVRSPADVMEFDISDVEFGLYLLALSSQKSPKETRNSPDA